MCILVRTLTNFLKTADTWLDAIDDNGAPHGSWLDATDDNGATDVSCLNAIDDDWATGYSPASKS